MVSPKKRGQGKPGIFTTGMGKSKPAPRSMPKHQIRLIFTMNKWDWVYYVGNTERAVSPRSYDLMAHASRSARTFRELLAHADRCEIVPPVDHKYSGG